jgi:hypothetical protein
MIFHFKIGPGSPFYYYSIPYGVPRFPIFILMFNYFGLISDKFLGLSDCGRFADLTSDSKD